MKERLTLYGAGGHCRVVADILEENNLHVTDIVDDNPKERVYNGLPIVKPVKEYDKVIITIGDGNTRKKISKKINVKEYISAIHKSAIISKSSTIGAGSVIMAGVVIQADTVIGKHCIVNTSASIDHGCKIHDFVHIAPGTTICGECEIGEESWIGAGAVIIQCLTIGKNCTIGAGSVIIEDIPDNAVVVGNPGRIIKFKS